jgi:hypothetical protein
LKGVAECAGATASELEPLLRVWHDASALGSQRFEEVQAAFAHAWDRVKYGAGDGPLARRLEEARKAPPPEALDYPEGSLRDAAALCWVLQREAGDRTFHVTTRALAEVLGYRSHNPAWQLICRLRRDGVIVLRQPARRGRAPEYSFRSADPE